MNNIYNKGTYSYFLTLDMPSFKNKIDKLEYIQHVSPPKSDIIVDCEDEHECKEDSSSTKKVPNVVAIKEIVHFSY